MQLHPVSYDVNKPLRCVFYSQDQVNAYKERLKLINAAPIKKIAEAKARKKRKVKFVLLLIVTYATKMYNSLPRLYSSTVITTDTEFTTH